MLTLNSRPYRKPLKGDTSLPDGCTVPSMGWSVTLSGMKLLPSEVLTRLATEITPNFLKA